MKYPMFESRVKQFLKTYQIENKEEYVMDIYSIEDSYTGRSDVQFANTFIYESTHLIINSINLFEMGYFDNAYYSLREAIEVSTTMIFFTDLSENEREQKRKEWSNLSRFPMQNQMLTYLENNGNEFYDIKNKLSSFFDETKQIMAIMNKIIHKQSFRYFYTVRNNLINKGKYNTNEFLEKYIYYLEKTIGIVAVMRLVVDPMPIILNDHDIYSRTDDTLTKRFPEKFLEKYIGDELIEEYKQSQLYQNHYNIFMENEQFNEPTLNIIKEHYVDTSKKEDIEKQYNLMGEWELYSSFLILNIDNVCKVHVCDGIQTYFSDRKSNRKKLGFDSRDFIEFSRNENRFNQEYDGTYISVINLRQDYFLEHNKKFSEEEVKELKYIEEQFNEKYPKE